MTDMTPGEWAAVAVCIVLLIATAWGTGRVQARRRREGRR